MKNSTRKIELTSVEDLFRTEENRAENTREKVMELPITELHAFKNHPFKIKDDETMMDTVESIQKYGVLVPAIARPDPHGGYELIVGHRRRHACDIAGIESMPVIVREMDDDLATIIMVDSNMQRDKLLPSERAFSYKAKLEAMKHQGMRTKTTSSQVGQKLSWAVNQVAYDANASKSQVQRYIRLTALVPKLLDMVDEEKIGLTPAYALSFLTPKEQFWLMQAMEDQQVTPSLSQAQRFKKLSADGRLTPEKMTDILSEQKKRKPGKCHIGNGNLAEVFSPKLHPAENAGNYHQTAGAVAAKAPAARTLTVKSKVLQRKNQE